MLTKPLGTGVLVSGSRQGRTSAADLATAIDGMRRLNRAASEALVAAGVRAATDVTGFGLLGHGLEMARASGTRFVFDAAALPALPGALELAAAGVETGGAAHNRRFVAGSLDVGAGVPAELVTLAHDPQTSGGLLAAVPPDRVGDPRGRVRCRRRRALVDRTRRGRRARASRLTLDRRDGSRAGTALAMADNGRSRPGRRCRVDGPTDSGRARCAVSSSRSCVDALLLLVIILLLGLITVAQPFPFGPTSAPIVEIRGRRHHRVPDLGRRSSSWSTGSPGRSSWR